MKGVLTAAISVAAMALLPAAAASAEEAPTRAQYVEQVDPICKANTEANKRILKNVKTKARSKSAKTVREAGSQFIQASTAFGAAEKKIAAVPRPPADDARLLKWFDQLDIVRTNLRKLGKALQGNEKILAAHEQVRVERAANAANNVSFVFEFQYCHLSAKSFF
jgi:hypothetical protein